MAAKRIRMPRNPKPKPEELQARAAGRVADRAVNKEAVRATDRAEVVAGVREVAGVVAGVRVPAGAREADKTAVRAEARAAEAEPDQAEAEEEAAEEGPADRTGGNREQTRN